MSARPPVPIADLVAAVQRNADIADGRHAADLTLCTYLLQMREFYRWAQRLPLGAALPREAVGAWIAEREALWDALDGEALAPLPLGDPEVDPFDVEAANAALEGSGLTYGAGLVAGSRPVFFLAELHGTGEREGLAVQQAGDELARTLLAPPAVLAGGGAGPIVIRRQSLARWCWERTEAFAMRPDAEGALPAMVRHYGLDADFHAALPRWLDDQIETAVLHEMGEHRVGHWLGPDWPALVQALPDARSQAMARALRDQLADLTHTLPVLLERAPERPGDRPPHSAAGPLHAWFAGYDGLREALGPGLAKAYRAWAGGSGMRPLREETALAASRLQALARRLLAQHAGGAAAMEQVQVLRAAAGLAAPAAKEAQR